MQELFRSQYFCREENADLFDLAEPLNGPTKESFTRLARELGVVIVGSIFERRTAGVYHNTALVIDADGEMLGAYRKMHIPDDPLYFEKYYFTPGDLGFRCFNTRFARIAPLVCWDQWYPEAARLAALAGAQVLIYPTAIGWHPAEKAEYGVAQHDAWRTIQRAHAIANGLLRCRREPCRFRGAARARSGILGRLLRRRSVRRRAGRSQSHAMSRPCWWNATRAASKRRAATGRSCATAASMPTRPSLSRVID